MKAFMIVLLVAVSCGVAPTTEPPMATVGESGAQGMTAKPAVARVVSDVRSVQAGSVFRVGVLIEMKPGWHIYWKNPGEAGLPTSVRFGAPSGFEVGDVVWPTPKQFSQPGDILGYGYEGAALFVAEVRAPAKLEPSADVTISVDANWLCCEKVCIPGRAELALKLAVGAYAKSGDAALFDAWKASIPLDVNDVHTLAIVRVGALPGRAASTAIPFEIDVVWKKPVTNVAWYPVPGDTLELVDVALESASSRTRITFSTSVLSGVGAPPASFESLVVFTDESGTRQALHIPVALRRDVNAAGPSTD